MRMVCLVLLVAALTGCTGAGTAPTSTTTVAPAPPTTNAPTTTAPTTTAPPAVVRVTADADVPAGLVTAAGILLSHAADPRNPAPSAPEGLVAHLGSAAIPDAVVIASATTATLAGGESVAVARTDAGDTMVAVHAGSGWRIVGADMATLGLTPWYGTSPRMVLVIGSDARPGREPPIFNGDSLHVVTALPEAGTGAILGWPRDSFVPTPYGDMKLTLLMLNRGPGVMEDLFRSLWELPVEGYILTGFSGFENLIGVFGGLTIDIPKSLPDQEWFAGFSAGEQLLAPIRVLDYVRTRKGVPGGDLTRSFNQGLVMLAVLQTIQAGGIEALPALLAALSTHAYTDLNTEQLLQLGAAAFTMDPATIENQVLPGQVGRSGPHSVVFLDPLADDMIADLRDDGLLTPRP